MNWSPFLEIFVGLFLVIGIGLGWFTRIAVWKITTAVALFVFGGLVLLSSFDPPANPGVSEGDVMVAAFLAGFAAVPALGAAAVGRMIKRRREK